MSLLSKAERGGGKSYFNAVLKRKPVLLEQLIVQSDDMARFNKDSVNTVRMSTFNTREGIVVPFAVIRVGRKGSFIDNCATGGICAAIDVKTGLICSNGGDELGGRYEAHPDSNQTFVGFAIPEWRQAKQLCRQAATLVPNLKYLSWDIAHSRDRGWMIVEVNTSGQFLWQGGTLTGVRTELRALMENMDLLTSYKL